MEEIDPNFMTINIIGDIAGRYDELMLLLHKMPKADLVVSVGDIVDRGPKSKEVIEWFMKNPKAIAIHGNHENMMMNFCKDPHDWNNRSMWLHNGGTQTLDSYRHGGNTTPMESIVPEEVVEWLEQCPLYFRTDDLLVSHAPINMDFDEIPDINTRKENAYYFIWNRGVPYKRVSYSVFHVYGHNGEYRSHTDVHGEYAACIDHSWRGQLMGMHWPSKEIFTQNYLPTNETLEERAKAEQREMTDEEKADMDFLRTLNP